uniref:GST N-terminal domain-containing protein n=1 Tax=Globodera pallida TaxID=36090 RepID=A0A183C8F9_GLOPA
MARQCLLGLYGTKCAQIPYRLLSNWRHSYGSNDKEDRPALFQFDGGDNAGDKFNKMRAEGHLFVDVNTINGWKDEKGFGRVAQCLEREIEEVSRTADERGHRKGRERSRNWAMSIIHGLFEWVYGRFPGIKRFLITELFPHYAAHFFI